MSRLFFGDFGQIADGTMARADSGDTDAIWFVAGGVKRHILDMGTVNALGGSGAVVSVLASDLDAMPTGPDVPAGTSVAALQALVASGTPLPGQTPQGLVSPAPASAVAPSAPLSPTAPLVGGSPRAPVTSSSFMSGNTPLYAAGALIAGMFIFKKMRKNRRR